MAWFWGTVRKAIHILPVLPFHPFLPLFFLSEILQQKLLLYPHGATYSCSFLVFSLHWQMKITMRLKSNCCLLPLQHGLPTHKLLSTLLRKISLLFYHGRRTGRVWFTSLQTILSHPAFPKCFLLIIKPCKSKRTLNMLNPQAASLSKGETQEAFHSS